MIPADPEDRRPPDRPVPDRGAMEEALAAFLEALGLGDAARGTAPRKAAEAWADELLRGYRRDPRQVLENTWPDSTSDMVVLRGVPFASVCEHHLLPFYGTAHLAYLPDGRLTGLSRLADLVDTLARRLQVQERLTEEVAEALMQGLAPRGAACLVEAAHDCVGARHLEYRGVTVQTVAWRGEFVADGRLQERFLRLAGSDAGRSTTERTPAGGPQADGASVDE